MEFSVRLCIDLYVTCTCIGKLTAEIIINNIE